MAFLPVSRPALGFSPSFSIFERRRCRRCVTPLVHEGATLVMYTATANAAPAQTKRQ
jgi:hypothetical protein